MEAVSKNSPMETGFLPVRVVSPSEVNQKQSVPERESNSRNSITPNPNVEVSIPKSRRGSAAPNDNYYRVKILDRFNESSLGFRNRDEGQFEQNPQQDSVDIKDLKNEDIFITKKVAYQMINDFGFLLSSKSIAARPNVRFEIYTTEEGIEPKSVVDFHSVVLLAHSAWFRRSWRSFKDNAPNEQYNFTYSKENNILGFFEINCDGLPERCDGEFFFSIYIDQFDKEFISAFNQFKKFLYRGDCQVTPLNAKFLLFYAHAFENTSLLEFMKILLLSYLPQQTLLGILEFLELAHIYDIEPLKLQCIKLINDYKEKVVATNTWKNIASKYPELVLQAFYDK